MLASGGRRSLRGAPRTGRPRSLTQYQKRLIAALKAGAPAQGSSSDLWTLGRVGKLVGRSLASDIDKSASWRRLKRLGFSSQRPSKRAVQRDERLFGNGSKALGRRSKSHQRGPDYRLHQQEVRRLERPHPVSTWAPKGQTPVLQYSFTWKQLSAVTGIQLLEHLLQAGAGGGAAPEIVVFLRALRRHLGDGEPLLIVWIGSRHIAVDWCASMSRARRAPSTWSSCHPLRPS